MSFSSKMLRSVANSTVMSTFFRGIARKKHALFYYCDATQEHSIRSSEPIFALYGARNEALWERLHFAGMMDAAVETFNQR